MMKLVGVVILVLVGFVLYTGVSQKGTPTADDRAKAQESATGVLEYWLEALRDDRRDDILAVSKPELAGGIDQVIDELYEFESEMGAQFEEFTLMGMGSPGAVKAILTSEKGGMMTLSMLAAQDEATQLYVVTQVTLGLL